MIELRNRERQNYAKRTKAARAAHTVGGIQHGFAAKMAQLRPRHVGVLVKRVACAHIALQVKNVGR